MATPTTAAGNQPPLLQEILPKTGLVYSEKSAMIEILSKPKLMPIKSNSLIRLEAMEKEAKEVLSAGAAPPPVTGQAAYAPKAAGGGAQAPPQRPQSAAGRPASATGRRAPPPAS